MLAAAYPAANTDTSAADNPNRLDLRVGQVTEVNLHQDASHLYISKVNLGEENPRTVISGLVDHISIEDMAQRLVVVLCNLKPAKMRGVISEGMILCTSGYDNNDILLHIYYKIK